MSDDTKSSIEDRKLSKDALENGTIFAPRFNESGLVPAIAVDAKDGTILMVAHMNAASLALSLETGIAHYWSRSRNSIWKKGETSGNVQKISEMRTDCDQDVILLKVTTGANGANCHTGRKSCFYRMVVRDQDGGTKLVFDPKDVPRFDPKEVYKT